MTATDSIRVVLADSDPEMAAGLQILLERGATDVQAGQPVEGSAFLVCAVVSDGEALVEAANRLRPDVIVTDIEMPRLNGLDAIRQLLAHPNRARAVVVTMHADAILAAQAFAAGASGCVLKHSAHDELSRAIRMVHKGLLYIPEFIARDLLFELTKLAGRGGDVTACDIGHTIEITVLQSQILQLIAEGYSLEQIANNLKLSRRKVESNKNRLMRSLCVYSTDELIACAARLGLIPSH